MGIRIRPASLQDIPLLVTFRTKQLDDEEEHPDIHIGRELEQWFTRVLTDGRLHQYILEEDGVPAAAGAYLELPLPPSFFRPKGRTVYITNMYTVPSYRKRGFASMILEHMKQEALKEGTEKMLLSASVWGRPVYERAGFQESNDYMILELK